MTKILTFNNSIRRCSLREDATDFDRWNRSVRPGETEAHGNP